MDSFGLIGCILLIINFAVSYKGFRDHSFIDRYSFHVGNILGYREYYRIITSGFIHVGWFHLILNMVALYTFSAGLENFMGIWKFLMIYTISLIGGNLFSLFIHRNHEDYSAVGASGAVSGLVFSSIALFPGTEVGFIGLPIGIPGWAFGFVYVLVSIYGIRSKRDNIGHEAHLGGGLLGMLLTIFMYPFVWHTNTLPIVLILVPSVAFIAMIFFKPHMILVDSAYDANRYQTIDDRYNASLIDRENELNMILEKIHQKGIDSLTKRERARLEEHSSVDKK